MKKAEAHLLIVDDEPEIVTTLSSYLRRRTGYRISSASGGRQARALLEASLADPSQAIDLVLADVWMDDGDGLTLLAWLRQHPQLQSTRVLMLTGASRNEDKVAALSAGADDYITKPYHAQELMARVETHLRTWQLEKQLQQQQQALVQARHLAVIGQLASGVAHEINNPLAAINANAQLIKMLLEKIENGDRDRETSEDSLSLFSSLSESVDLIIRATDRAATVVGSLLQFARQEQYVYEQGSVNHSIEQALDLVSYQLRSAQVETSRQLAPDLPTIAASWEHIKSAWTSVLIHARDALAERRPPRRLALATELSADGDWINVSIHDNGPGMKAAAVKRIFEPFYTSGRAGSGTGLGLAIAQRIIQQHGGQIEVQSAPGEGTTFLVRLPVVSSQ